MDSNPRRWVLKPLSPLLQPSDLRTITAPPQLDPDLVSDDSVFATDSISISGSHSSVFVSSHRVESPGDLVVQARQVSVSVDGGSTSDEWHHSGPSIPSTPISPCSSSSSHCGFYSFVEDPMSPEAEQNEAWMVSPQRQAKLATLKEEKDFKVQTYSSSRKPESLFQDINGDSRYRVEPENGVEVVGQEEETQLRQEIIRSQAPKKNLFGENLNSTRSTKRLIEGLSLSYSPVHSKPEAPCQAESRDVEQEQINFNAARQQFVKMEMDKRNVIIQPLRIKSRLSLSSSLLPHEVSSQRQVKAEETSRKVMVYPAEESLNRQSNVFDDLDSSLDELSPGLGDEHNNDEDVSTGQTQSKSRMVQSRSTDETPIEKEIRLTQEREEVLRRSRGLSHDNSGDEMVQIKTTRLTQTPVKAKDKSRVTFRFHQENRRREDLQEQVVGQNSPDLPHDEVDMDLKTVDRPECESRGGDRVPSPSPCCPEGVHTSFNTKVPNIWRGTLETSGLRSRTRAGPDFIEQEIEEDLRREQELREVRESREEDQSPNTTSPAPLVEQANRMVIRQFYPPLKIDKPESRLSWSSPRPIARQLSVSMVTAQPLSPSPSPPPTTPPPCPSPWSVSLPVRGLTETLLQDFEDRRMKLKDSAYAGIQPIDYINNEVVESTRVIRHKNQRAVQWEAGIFANTQHQ